MEHLFFYPAASEYRKLTIEQDEDGTWAYEWKSRKEGFGFASQESAYHAAMIEGKLLYPGIVPATGDENAYGAVQVEDDSGV